MYSDPEGGGRKGDPVDRAPCCPRDRRQSRGDGEGGEHRGLKEREGEGPIDMEEVDRIETAEEAAGEDGRRMWMLAEGEWNYNC